MKSHTRRSHKINVTRSPGFHNLIMCTCIVVMEEAEEEKTDVIVNIRELDDVLIKDVGDHIASSGK